MRVKHIKSYAEGDRGRVSRVSRNRAGGGEHLVTFDDGSTAEVEITIAVDGGLTVDIRCSPEHHPTRHAFDLTRLQGASD